MDLDKLISYYSTGDYLYMGVLRRHFGYDEAKKLSVKLISDGYFTGETLFRCPKCNFALFNSSQDCANYYLKSDKIFCNACDYEFSPVSLDNEILLCRTDKPYIDEYKNE